MSIKPEVQALCDRLKANAVIGEDGSPKLADDAYAATLPEGMTLEQRKAWERHDNTFICASALAFGQLSTDQMQKDPKLENTATRVAMGSSNLDLAFKRSSEVNDGKGGRVTVHGSISAKYRVKAHLKSVKDELRARAATALV